jgi:hypothetical protein
MCLHRLRRHVCQVNHRLPDLAPEATIQTHQMNDQQLDKLLRSAKGGFPLAEGFNHAVWSRIESQATPGHFWQRMFGWTGRPLGVACGVAAMVSLGLFFGAATVPESTDSQLSYMESISPFVHLSNR